MKNPHFAGSPDMEWPLAKPTLFDETK